jgi:hypothetical protein
LFGERDERTECEPDSFKLESEGTARGEVIING